MFDYLFWCLLIAPIVLIIVYAYHTNKEVKEIEECLTILQKNLKSNEKDNNYIFTMMSRDISKIQEELKKQPVATLGENNGLHDAHYKKLKAEPWDIMEANMTHEEFVGFLKGNIQKYLHRNKEGLKDYEKLVNYGNKLVKVVKEHVKNSK